MNRRLETSLSAALESRSKRGLKRSLYLPSPNSIDFCSNDYLGFARSAELQELVEKEWQKERQGALLGSTGSRLLTGNSHYSLQLEAKLCQIHSAESALLFNSGYDLNLGLFAALPQPGSLVLYDELVHNSIRQGLKLCRAKTRSFAHNCPTSLETALGEWDYETDGSGSCIVALESVYSMDGHCAPLVEMVSVCESYGASIVLDEAHGVGVFGEGGRGWANELGVESKIFARIYTFGKAMGCHGAVVVGPKVLREYLVNYARTLIYSTALPLHSLVCISQAYDYCLARAKAEQTKLRKLVTLMRNLIDQSKVLSHDTDERDLLYTVAAGEVPLELLSPIVAVVVPGNAQVVAAANHLQSKGYDVKAIRSPTVPAGLERLRVIIHTFNTEEQVTDLVRSIESSIGGQSRS